MSHRQNPRFPSEVIEEQRATIKRLTVELEQMRRAASMPLDACFAFDLTKSENVILSLLLSREIVSLDSFMQVLYGDRVDDMPSAEVIRTFISRIRSLLPPGTEIKSKHSIGYFITRSDKFRIRATLNHKEDDDYEHGTNGIRAASAKAGPRAVGGREASPASGGGHQADDGGYREGSRAISHDGAEHHQGAQRLRRKA